MVNEAEIFSQYPDIVDAKQMREMLDIGDNLAYSILRDGTIPSRKVGREYKILKKDIIDLFCQ